MHTHTQTNITTSLSMLLFGFFFCILLVSDLSTALQMDVWALGNVECRKTTAFAIKILEI